MVNHILTQQVWAVLVRAAGERRTLTYADLAAQLEGGRANVTARTVNAIQDYCDRQRLPRLNDLVVSKQRGWPSYVSGPGYDFAAARERVFAFDWTTIRATMSDFARAEASARARSSR